MSFPQASSSVLPRRMQSATCPRGLQKPSISAHRCQPEKKRRQGHFLGQPICSNCTSHRSAQISSFEPHLAWGLDTEPGEGPFVLPAESAFPTSLLLWKAADSAVCLFVLLGPSPPESLPAAPTLIQAEPLAFGSCTDTKCSVNYVQAIPLECRICTSLQIFLVAELSLIWAGGGLHLPSTSHATKTGVLQTSFACVQLQLLGI